MNTRALAGLVAGLAALQVGSAARAERIYLSSGASIVTTDTTSLGTTSSVPVTGMQGGETLVGIDVRPANQGLYGVGSTNRIYTINPTTGVATQVGASGQFVLNGTAYGTDFNPTVDRIRQVSNTEQNLRLNPVDGTLTATDTPLNPAGNVVGVAYSNNFPGASSTTLYAIDSAAGTLGIISNPNAGGPITTVGTTLGLGPNLNENIGFDISGLPAGTAYASITTGGLSRLYTINLSTGTASLVASNGGVIGNGATPFSGLAAASAPEPGTIGLLGVVGTGLLLRRRSARRC